LKEFFASLKGGKGHEAGHEPHGPAPHVSHESGHEGGGYGAHDSAHGHLFKRSVDESSDRNTNHDSSEKKKLSPKEAYVLHKNSLVALKEQVDAEISALDKLNEAEVSKSTSSGAEHVLQKRSADGLKVHLLRRRSLETIREQINGEIALLEEGDYAAEIQEVYDRRRRTVNGMEILQKPEIKKVKSGVQKSAGKNQEKNVHQFQDRFATPFPVKLAVTSLEKFAHKRRPAKTYPRRIVTLTTKKFVPISLPDSVVTSPKSIAPTFPGKFVMMWLMKSVFHFRAKSARRLL